jgi:hypothetical protein
VDYCSSMRFPHNVRCWSSPREWWRAFQHWHQRGTKGYSYRDLWSLDNFLAVQLATVLSDFRDATWGYPSTFESMEEWEAVLDEMVEGFTIWAEHDTMLLADEDNAKVERALALFAEWFRALWY